MKAVSMSRTAIAALLFGAAALAADPGPRCPGLDFRSLVSDASVLGSVTVLDLDRGDWYFSDESDARRGSIPASTFKIPNLLIALEEGVIRPGERMAWDGVVRGFKGRPVVAWNRDLDAAEAFESSAIWFFVELSRRVPRSSYAHRLEDIGYGNGALGESGPDFWNYGAFRVSPVEQLRLLAALARDGLPFSTESQAFVRRCMLADGEGRGILRMKSGWGFQDGKDLGWLVGWLECPEGRFAFATRLRADSVAVPADFSSIRKAASLAAVDAVRNWISSKGRE
jgi:beta-lactamase class D